MLSWKKSITYKKARSQYPSAKNFRILVSVIFNVASGSEVRNTKFQVFIELLIIIVK